MWCHASAVTGFIIPFSNMLGPYWIWRNKSEEFPEIYEHGRAAVNFQLSMSLYFAISCVLLLVWVGLFFMIGLAVFQALNIYLATIEAHDHDQGVYRYRFSIEFFKSGE